MNLKKIIMLFVLILPVISSGCGRENSKSNKEAAQNEFLIFCGGGLRPPVAELAGKFAKENEVKVLTDYAGAEVLISKARLSKRGDIYIPGDKGYVDIAAKNGLILSQKSICYFVPTIFVQKGNPKRIKSLKDLTNPGIKLGFGNPEYIPIGRKTREIFEKNKLYWNDIEKKLKFQSATVNELCIQIQAKSLDAVIVWDAVAHSYLRYGELIMIPIEQNVISTVDAGVLKFTANRELADKFVNFLRSDYAKAVFHKYNYRVDKPE
ncbi:MAG: molybdate ABC transporter substrate-binding protein [Bacteroidales bacterium]|nr:molybdate ABC transporter substrate-binding protein [Bacteroidales bacterium]